MTITCKEFANRFDIDYLQASSIIKLLLKHGVAKKSDKIMSGNRGRPTVKYDIPDNIIINLKDGSCTTPSPLIRQK